MSAHILGDVFVRNQLLAPASRAEAVYTSSYIDTSNAEYVEILLSAGAIATGATVDLAILQGTDTSGTGSKAITGASLVQIADTGDNLLYAITVKAEQLDIAGGYHTIAAKLTVGGTTVTVLCDVIATLYRNRHMPAASAGLTQDVRVY